MADTGVVIMHTSMTIPDGWAVCDGSPHGSPALEALIGPNTPDLRDRFIRGAGATPLNTVGGRRSAVLKIEEMPSHNHGGATAVDGEHAHNGRDTSISRSMSHTHSGTTGTDSANHTHSSPSGTTTSISANHTHPTQINEGNGDGDGGNYTDTNPTNSGSTRDIGSSNSNSVSHYHSTGAVNTQGASARHYHAITAAATDINHTHNFSSGAPGVGHLHGVRSAGSATPIDLVPVHYAVLFLIKL